MSDDPLTRYMLRHPAAPNGATTDEHLLLLAIAGDTRKLLLLAEENQAFIRQTMMEMTHADNTTNQDTTEGTGEGPELPGA